MTSKSARGPMLLIAAAATAAYVNSFRGAFVFDDVASIPENPTLRRVATAFFPPHDPGITVLARPLLNASLALNWAISGPAVWSYHAVNLMIHIGAAWLMLALVRRQLPVWAATVAALLWAVHPLGTEAVSYIVQRAESLAALFILAGLYWFENYAEGRGRRWAVATVLATLLGFAAKETAWCLPLLVLLYDRTFLAGSFAAAWRRRRGLYVALLASYGWFALLLRSSRWRGGTVSFDSVSWGTYAETQLHSFGTYLRLCVWPAPLIFDYGAQWFRFPAVLPGAVLTAAALALAAAGLLSPRWRRPGFLAATILLILAPTSLVPGTRQTAAEHRMYLPLAAAITLLVGAVPSPDIKRTESDGAKTATPKAKDRSAGKSRVALPLALAVLPLAALTAHRNRDYRSPEVLYRDTVMKLPDDAFAHYDLGDALHDRGAEAEAAAEYRKVLQLSPELFRARFKLGECELELRDYPAAESAYRTGLAAYPNSAAARVGLARALQHQGRWAEAADEFGKAALLDPSAVASAAPSRLSSSRAGP